MSANSNMTTEASSGGSGAVRWNAPSSESVEEFTKDKMPQPNYVQPVDNIAKSSKDAVEKFRSQSHDHYQRFMSQSARKDLETYLKDADAKFRMSQLKARKYKDGSKQKQNTLSQLPSGQYQETCRLMTSALQAISFGDEQELPARFEAVKGSKDYSEDDGKRIAAGQNAVLKDVWDKEHWNEILKESIHYAVKNGHEVICMEWDKSEDTQTERVPGYYDANGEAVEYDPEAPPIEAFDRDGIPLKVNEDNMPMIVDEGNKSFIFIEKTRTIRDCPVIDRKDLKNIYWDMDIDGFQNQTAVILRGQKTLQSLLMKQKQGLYDNVHKLSVDQLYSNETKDGSEILQDRDDNADQDQNHQENGLYDIYHVFMYAPIKDGKWDKNAIPKLWEAVYAGDFSASTLEIGSGNDKKKANGSVCLMLRESPYNHKSFPYKLIVTHPDDRGSLHMGFYSLLEANIEEQSITINQLIDNKTLAIKTPFIAEKGAFMGKDAYFRDGNQLMWRAEGSSKDALTQLTVNNVTQRTVEELAMMRERADSLIGTTEAFRGEFAGSRATATEVIGNKSQALKPVLELAKFLISQYVNFILPTFMSLSRQYADPDQFIEVDGLRVYPAELYGELDTKIVSIEKYEADLQSRQVLTNAIQAGAYTLAEPSMGAEGKTVFWKNYWKQMKLPDVELTFPAAAQLVEAVNQANADVRAIMQNPERAMSDQALLPQPGEKHDIHVKILEDKKELMIAQSKMPVQEGAPLHIDGVPPEISNDPDYLKKVIGALTFFITIHKQIQVQEQQQSALAQQGVGGGSPQNQAQEVPAQAGEASGDVLGGVGGQLAQ